MLSNLRKVMRDTKDRGASAVEYGLMVAAIAALIVGVVFGLGGVVQEIFTSTCDNIHQTAGTEANCDPTPPANGGAVGGQ
jgi:pilus assembly protein Flp/PilA